MDGERYRDLDEEIDIILSIKNKISEDEIVAFTKKYRLYTQEEIRTRISLLSGESCPQDISNYAFDQSGLPAPGTDKIAIRQEKDGEVEKTEDLSEKYGQEKEVSYEARGEVQQTDVNLRGGREVESETAVPEIIGLAGEVKYNQLSLHWQWPENIQRALILYRPDCFPDEPDDTVAARQLISRVQHDRRAEFTLARTEERAYYFTIFSVIIAGDKMKFSKGRYFTILNSGCKEIIYDIKSHKSLFGKLRKLELVFHGSGHEIELPEIAVVKKGGTLPLSITDGEIIERYDNLVIPPKKGLTVSINIDKIDKASYIKVFLIDESKRKIYRIIAPPMEALYMK